MSLKKSFAQVFKYAGLAAPFSLAAEMTAAIDRDDAAEVLALYKLNPQLLQIEEGKPDQGMFVYAITTEKPAVAKALAKEIPALLTATDENGATILMKEARSPASAASFDLLLSLYSAEQLELQDKNGNSVAHCAARPQEENARTLEAVLKAAPQLATAVNSAGAPPLIDAARMGSPAGVKLLLASGAKVNEPLGAEKLNATMIAIHHSNLGTAITLMEAGGIVDYSSPVLETQLRVATYEGPVEFGAALVARRSFQEREEDATAKAVAVVQAAAAEMLMAGVVAPLGQGTGNEVAAPSKAAFKKRMPDRG